MVHLSDPCVKGVLSISAQILVHLGSNLVGHPSITHLLLFLNSFPLVVYLDLLTTHPPGGIPQVLVLVIHLSLDVLNLKTNQLVLRSDARPPPAAGSPVARSVFGNSGSATLSLDHLSFGTVLSRASAGEIRSKALRLRVLLRSFLMRLAPLHPVHGSRYNSLSLKHVFISSKELTHGLRRFVLLKLCLVSGVPGAVSFLFEAPNITVHDGKLLLLRIDPSLLSLSVLLQLLKSLLQLLSALNRELRSH